LADFAKCGWRIFPNPPAKFAISSIFGGFPRLARPLNKEWHELADQKWRAKRKGRIQMSGQSKIMSTLIAAIASLLVSSVAVGAAVGPAHVAADSVEASIYA
jgi:hypothetical protein